MSGPAVAPVRSRSLVAYRKAILSGYLWLAAIVVAIVAALGLLPLPLSTPGGLPLLHLFPADGGPAYFATGCLIGLLGPAAVQFSPPGRRLHEGPVLRLALMLASLIPALLAGIVEVAAIAALASLVPGDTALAGLAPIVRGTAASLSGATEIMFDALITVDARGKILSANGAATRLLGHDGVGRHASRFLPVLKTEDYADLGAAAPLLVETELRRESSEPVKVEVSPPQVAYRETITQPAKYDYTHKKQTGGSGQYGKISGMMEPNPDADFAEYVEGFNFTEREFRLIKEELEPGGRTFIIKQGHVSVVAKLDLKGFDYELDVISGRARNVALMKQLIAEHGEDPAVWLPKFRQARDADRAAGPQHSMPFPKSKEATYVTA